MTTPPNIQHLVQLWIDKAEEDYIAAQHLLLLNALMPTSVICFHAQQIVEKYLKALLTQRQISVPKTHDMEVLVLLIQDAELIGLKDFEIFDLSEYAVETRYPGMDEPSSLTPEVARKAFETAGRVRNAIRKVLGNP